MRPKRQLVSIGITWILLGLLNETVHAESISALRSEAYRLSEGGSAKQAMAALDDLLDRRPRDLEARTRRGNLHLRLNHAEQAFNDFDAAVRYAPWSPSHYVNRGIARVMLGQYEDAQADFQKALRLLALPLNRDAKTTASAHCGLGQIYHRVGQNDEAFQEYDQAIRINPADPSGYLGRAELFSSLGKFDRAITDYSEAIRIAPTLSRAYSFRGDALSQLGREDEALVDFNAALNLDPDDGRARSFRGSLFAKRGDNLHALEDFDALIRVDPERAAAYKDRGGVLVRIGQYAKAIEDLDKAIRLDPRKATAYLNRGAAYNSLGQYERALEDFEETMRLAPSHPGGFANAGVALSAIGQYDQAISHMTEAVRLDPKNTLVLMNRAETYAKVGLDERAVDDYEAVIKLNPKLARAHAGLGNAQVALGRPDKAVHEYDLAIVLDPKIPSIYCDRGNLKRAQGDWQGAIDDFTKAIEINPRQETAYVLRGWSRLMAGAPGADQDARNFLILKKAPDPAIPYMAILGALAARREGREASALAFLDDALKTTSPTEWPTPLLRYLRREIPAQHLLDSAYDTAKKTEARTFLALDRLQANDLTTAIANLRWVRDHGPAGSSATDLARAVLDRVDGSRAELARP